MNSSRSLRLYEYLQANPQPATSVEYTPDFWLSEFRRDWQVELSAKLQKLPPEKLIRATNMMDAALAAFDEMGNEELRRLNDLIEEAVEAAYIKNI